MRRSVRFVLMAFAVGLAACGGDREATTTGPEFASGRRCDFKAVDEAVRNYFGSALQSSVLEIVRNMESACNDGDAALATSYGFDVLRQISEVRLSNPAGTVEEGSTLANAVIARMDVGVTAAIDFTPSLGERGAFVIRGGTSFEPPVTAADGYSAVNAPGGNFLSWLGGETLFYGYPIGTGTATETVIGARGYEWSTVPAHPSGLNGLGTVGLCAGLTDRDRLQKGPQILLSASVEGLGLECENFDANGNPLEDETELGWAGRLIEAGRDLLMPTALHATLRFGGTGGLAGGFTPYVVVDPKALNPVFTVQPTNARAGATLSSVTVFVGGANGTPMPGVTVTITASTNTAGSFTLTGTTVRETGNDGKATFNDLVLNKAGGYNLIATVSDDGYTTAAKASNGFQLKNAK